MFSRSHRTVGLRTEVPKAGEEAEFSEDQTGVPCQVKVMTHGLALMLFVLFVGLTRWSQSSSSIPSAYAISDGFSGTVKALALSADDRVLYGCVVDGTHTVWNPQLSQAKVAALQGNGILKAAFTRDGTTLGVVDAAGSFSLWSLAKWEQWARIPPRTGLTSALSFSRDSATLALADGSGVRLWDTATATPKAGPELVLSGVSSLEFAADGRTLAVGTRDGFVRLWDSGQGSQVAWFRAHRSYIRSLAFSHDGRVLATSSPHERTTRLWDLETGRFLREFDGSALIQALAFAPSRNLELITAGNNGSVRLWDVETGDLRWALSEGDGPVTSLAFSADGDTLACGTAGAVRLYRLDLAAQTAAR